MFGRAPNFNHTGTKQSIVLRWECVDSDFNIRCLCHSQPSARALIEFNPWRVTFGNNIYCTSSLYNVVAQGGTMAEGRS